MCARWIWYIRWYRRDPQSPSHQWSVVLGGFVHRAHRLSPPVPPSLVSLFSLACPLPARRAFLWVSIIFLRRYCGTYVFGQYTGDPGISLNGRGSATSVVILAVHTGPGPIPTISYYLSLYYFVVYLVYMYGDFNIVVNNCNNTVYRRLSAIAVVARFNYKLCGVSYMHEVSSCAIVHRSRVLQQYLLL